VDLAGGAVLIPGSGGGVNGRIQFSNTTCYINSPAGTGNNWWLVVGGFESLRSTATASGTQVGVNVGTVNDSGRTFQINPHLTGGNSWLSVKATATGTRALQYWQDTHSGATLEAGANANALGGTVFGVSNNGATSLLHIAGTGGPMFVGSQVAVDVVFGANDAEKFRLVSGGAFTLKDAVDVAVGTATGTKFGTSTTQKMAWWNATPVVQQTNGANLTNSVTVGGTNDTIADFTDLTTYANDAAAIRNDIYQLARKLKVVNDAVRVMGLMS
jgi:hypothetical protein